MNNQTKLILLAIMLTVNLYSNHAISKVNDSKTVTGNKKGVRDKSNIIIKKNSTSRAETKTRDSSLSLATNTPPKIPMAAVNPNKPAAHKPKTGTPNNSLPPATSKPPKMSTATFNPIHPAAHKPKLETEHKSTSRAAIIEADKPKTKSTKNFVPSIHPPTHEDNKNNNSTRPTKPVATSRAPFKYSNSVPIKSLNFDSDLSISTQPAVEKQNSTSNNLRTVKTSTKSHINEVPVKIDSADDSKQNLITSMQMSTPAQTEINEPSTTDSILEINTPHTLNNITNDSPNITTYTDNNSAPSSTLGNGSLIGASLPQNVNIPNYPKSYYDPKFYVANQLIILSLDMPQAKKTAQLIKQYQARIIRRIKLNDLNFVLSTFRFPKNINVKQVIKAIKNKYPDIIIEPNHYFFPQSKNSTIELNNRNEVFNKINKPVDRLCGINLKIGMLDGPIETSHISLKNQQIIQKNFYAKGEKLATYGHATAIASLLVGDPKVKGLAGVISEATLYSGNVMQQHPKNKRKMLATTESIILGLNWLISKQVNVINLSLGGKPNRLLAVALKKVIDKKIVVVSSAGNGGPNSEPSYPAAMDNIISVTSVDHKERIASDANQGNYIDIAAPGVDIWVAGKNNSGRYASGTSIAAPLVSAAAALLVQKKQSINMLFEQAIDLGSSGKDFVFGHGLLQFSSCGE